MATIETIKQLDTLIPWFIRTENVWSHYDQLGDVLYLHFKKPNLADDTELTEDDILIRFEKGEIIGLTVMNASKRMAGMLN